jgi:ABC-type multidrug transport system fused ATPase/permease subunit
MKIRNNLLNSETLSVIKRSFRILQKRDRSKIGLILILQIFLGVLDLLGIATIGAVGALAVNGIASKPQSGRIAELLEFLNLENFTFQGQVAILGLFATAFLVTRTILSVYFQRRTLYFLSYKGSQISGVLFSKFISQPLSTIQTRSSQDALFSLTTGVNTVTIGIIGSLIALASDAALLLIVFFGLFVFDPTIAINTLIFFSFVALSLHVLLSKKARSLGYANTLLQIQSNKEILEVLSGFRELFVKNALHSYSQKVIETRTKISSSTAELAFLPYISKYVIESSVVLGTLLISATQFLLYDASRAIATLAIFLSAGTRIAPAVLRMQQGTLQIKTNVGAAKPTLDLIDDLAPVSPISGNKVPSVDEFLPLITLSNVCHTYPGKANFEIQQVSLTIPPGSHAALVGPSGAGKSTLVDLILGVIKPSSGNILISNVSPQIAIGNWPNAISYLPQEVCIVEGTVFENLVFGLAPEHHSKDRAWAVLRAVDLAEFFIDNADGLDTSVGERGSRLSGGQRQRLGIARALYTAPSVLVLDEATSALDGQSEALLTKAIQELKGKTTLITVAHRLSTVLNADQVIYVENGRVIQTGTFEHVRKSVPNFDTQANLLGL